MRFTELPLAGAYRVELEPRGDARGFFARLFCAEEFAARGLATGWVQCNTSFTAAQGTVRGLHFQRPPMAETKLLRCIRGAIFDVIVDLRAGSPTFGRWHGERLDDQNRAMICVPEGFAHGFQTLTPDVEMLYFHSAPYSAAHEGGLRWDDAKVAVSWPLGVTEMSARDAAFPTLDKLEPIAK
ncbi:dTDP-4-dehydrorhamnose 3,5-epimerase [Rhodobacter sp. HX-7-19]|uniref:dTDP-4-dehydrorhamnose 3,5-epimerase n=1 Tax=Paragemmobacter kunshanensis TaxID=2583234 RepID=A0A6M1U065_9RHOB|nr:dTDP-4-dehydrorhamnose 3,5-epimerase [Rhodobacter kunshanensis]